MDIKNFHLGLWIFVFFFGKRAPVAVVTIIGRLESTIFGPYIYIYVGGHDVPDGPRCAEADALPFAIYAIYVCLCSLVRVSSENLFFGEN